MTAQQIEAACEQIAKELSKFAPEERRQIFSIIEYIFCTSCGRLNNPKKILRSGRSSACIHERAVDMPNGLMERQKYLEEQDNYEKRMASYISGMLL